MYIKRILVNGKEQGIQQNVHLKSINDDLVLDFEGKSKDSTQYFYRIKEINPNWSTSNYPTAHYQNLSGGVYTFEIYASDAPKLINSLKIEVKEAFWQRWWFMPSIIGYVILIVGIGIYLFFLYDFRQKLKMQNVRNQIASDLHDEVGSNLNSIAVYVELLRKKAKKQDELTPILDRISSNSEETVSLMRDTVWAINPNNDSTEKLIEKMRSFGFEILSAKDIAFEFKSEIETKKDLFSMEQRRNIYLIYKEAINNIAKHAAATKASCRIIQNNGQIEIEIIDNGAGFNQSLVFEGNGLKNFKIRSQEEDLKVILNSEQGKGTMVRVVVSV